MVVMHVICYINSDNIANIIDFNYIKNNCCNSKSIEVLKFMLKLKIERNN